MGVSLFQMTQLYAKIWFNLTIFTGRTDWQDSTFQVKLWKNRRWGYQRMSCPRNPIFLGIAWTGESGDLGEGRKGVQYNLMNVMPACQPKKRSSKGLFNYGARSTNHATVGCSRTKERAMILSAIWYVSSRQGTAAAISLPVLSMAIDRTKKLLEVGPSKHNSDPLLWDPRCGNTLNQFAIPVENKRRWFTEGFLFNALCFSFSVLSPPTMHRGGRGRDLRDIMPKLEAAATKDAAAWRHEKFFRSQVVVKAGVIVFFDALLFHGLFAGDGSLGSPPWTQMIQKKQRMNRKFLPWQPSWTTSPLQPLFSSSSSAPSSFCQPSWWQQKHGVYWHPNLTGLSVLPLQFQKGQIFCDVDLGNLTACDIKDVL